MSGRGTLSRQAGRGAIVNLFFGGLVDGLAIIQGILIPRLLGPDDIGLFALASGGVAIGLALKAVDLPRKVVQERDVDLHTAYGVAFTLELVLAGIFLIAVLGVAPLLAYLFDRPELWLLTSVLGTTIFSTAFLELPAAIPYREMRYLRRNVLTAVGPVVMFVVTVPAAFLGAGVWSLAMGTLAGFGAATVVLFFASPIKPSLTWDRVIVRRFLDFGWPAWLSGIAALVGGWGSAFAISATVGVPGLGYFDLAQSWAARALQIDGVLGDTVFPALCTIQSSVDRLRRAFVLITRLTMLWAAPVGFASLLFAKPAIDLLLGSAWQPALILVQAESAGIIINSIGQSWFLFYAARGQTKPLLLTSLLGLSWVALIVVPLLLLFGLDGAAMSIIALAVGGYAIRTYFVRRIFGRMSLVALVWRELLVGGTTAAAVVGLRALGWEIQDIRGLVAQAVAYVALAAIAAATFSRALVREIIDALRSKPRRGSASDPADEVVPGTRLTATPRPMAFPLLVAADASCNAVWITTRDWPALGRLDLGSGECRWTELPPFPHAPSPDGTGGCWTALTRSSALAHVDQSGTVQLVDLPKTRELLVSVVLDGCVFAVDSTRRCLHRLRIETGELAVMPLPGDFVRPDFVAVASDGRLWVADTQTTALAWVSDPTSSIPVITGGHGPHPTRSVVADEGSGGMWLGDSSGPHVSLLGAHGGVQRTVDLLAVPFGMAMAPNGQLIVAAKDHDALFVVDRDSSEPTAVALAASSMPMGVAVAGDRCFVTLAASSELLELPLSTMQGRIAHEP